MTGLRKRILYASYETSPGISLNPSKAIDLSEVKEAEISRINGTRHIKAVKIRIVPPTPLKIMVDKGDFILFDLPV